MMSPVVIKDILLQYRQWRADQAVASSLSSHSNSNNTRAVLKQKVAVVHSWLSILSDEQRFVVTKHLLDRLPWPLVVIEYEKRWGIKAGKAERTLKRFQSQALQTIITFIHNSEQRSDIMKLFDME